MSEKVTASNAVYVTEAGEDGNVVVVVAPFDKSLAIEDVEISKSLEAGHVYVNIFIKNKRVAK